MKQPIAIRAALAPPRAEPSRYPAVFAPQPGGRVKQTVLTFPMEYSE